MSCAAKNCTNCKRLRPPGISFHWFPKDSLFDQWIKALGLCEDFKWSKNKYVCSKHFKATDFIKAEAQIKLNISAVPSLLLNDEEKQVERINVEPNITINYGPSTSQMSHITVDMSTSSSSLKSSGDRRQISKKRSCSKKRGEVSGTNSESSGTKRRIIEFVEKIHNYNIAPRKLKDSNIKIKQHQKSYRKKLYTAKRKITTLKKEVHNLKSVDEYLKSANYLSENATNHLEKSFIDVPKLLMSRHLKNVECGTVTHETYPKPLREFAATLQFYSSKAYEVVRKEFSLALPHQATIRKWYSTIDCSPGYIEVAFNALKVKYEESQQKNRELVCSLMLDEMCIKKSIEFDGKKMWGYVDVGTPLDNDELEPATEAFVVMVVAHQSHWKLPIAYFLVKSLTGREKANILNECLLRLHEVGVNITSITCDGPSTNFTMMKELGCNFDNPFHMKTWFTHPCNVNQKIYCVFDACHMLKLARNNFASLEVFQDPDGKMVKWAYIEKLYNLQEKENLYIANKLRKSHMEWYRQKMKVHLAAQTISESIATAIEFLNAELHLPEFSGCEATVRFIRIINILFDILNSRSPWAKNYKAPLKMENEDVWRPFIIDAVNYLLRCTDVTGRPLYATPKKTPFIGFTISALSICGIFDDYVKTTKLNYILTYKCSQDHLEIWFCSIRSRNGWNNNPTALQFVRSFRRLLLLSKIADRGGNCRVLDTTTILTVPSTGKNKSIQEDKLDISFCRKYSIEPSTLCVQDHDYDVIPNFISLSEVAVNVVTYIAGYVIKMLKRSLSCLDCICNCSSTINMVEEGYNYKLLTHKNKGGLQTPSAGVLKICTAVEINLRNVLQCTDNKLPADSQFLTQFVIATSQQFITIGERLFPDLKYHIMDTAPNEESHYCILIKGIILAYARIRIFNLAKKYTATIQGPIVRRQLAKLILFHNQKDYNKFVFVLFSN